MGISGKARRGWIYFGEKLYYAWGKRRGKILEEGDNSRRRVSINDWDREDKEWRGSCSRYYWSVGSGARKPVGFLGPTHHESWSAGWHIMLLIKARLVGWKAWRGRSLQVYSKILDLLRPLAPGISIPDKYILNLCMVLLSSLVQT